MFEGLKRFFSWNNKASEEEYEIPDSEGKDNSGLRSLSHRNFTGQFFNSLFDGEKYPGGLNSDVIDFFYIDYWTLRRRSYKLFTENRYAKGLISRLLTNEIHRGLTLESTPNAKILGKTDEEINEWTDDIEAKYDIWGANKELVSYNQLANLGEIQIDIRKTALLSGDVLVVLRQHPTLRTPTIELFDGGLIRTPLKKTTNNEIRHGVEIDKRGRHIAFYVQDASDRTGIKSVRIPARGSKSGRRIAWMVYGHKIRIDDVRGMPILGILLQALKELDRYSDAEQRAAVLNSIIPLFIKKGADKIGTRPLTGGAVRRESVNVDSGSDTGTRSFDIAGQIPGLVMENLQVGEEPVSFNTVRPNVNYAIFEEAMMASFAWANEIPPTIFRLAFSSNYSASGAEINELKLYLSKVQWLFGNDVLAPIYKEWLIGMAMTGLIKAPELLASWRDTSQFLISGSWFSSEWSGVVKPSLRRLEELNTYIKAIKEGLVTRDMATKAMYGRKFTTMSKRLIRENEQLAAAMLPLMEAGLIPNLNINSDGNNNSGTA